MNFKYLKKDKNGWTPMEWGPCKIDAVLPGTLIADSSKDHIIEFLLAPPHRLVYYIVSEDCLTDNPYGRADLINKEILDLSENTIYIGEL